MSDYEVGYGKPPKATQFKKGTSPNPKGRPKRKPDAVSDVIKDVLNTPVEYREGGQTKNAPRRELALKRHLKRAVEGNVASAAAVLKLRAQAAGKRDAISQVVQFTDLLPADAALLGEGQVDGPPAHDETEMPLGQRATDPGPTGNGQG